MNKTRPLQWYHSQTDLIWSGGKDDVNSFSSILDICFMVHTHRHRLPALSCPVLDKNIAVLPAIEREPTGGNI
jgi:hypothetical protein